MKKLLFLSNELLNPDLQKELKVPLHFISFAMTEGKMYRHFRNTGTFLIREAQHFPRYAYGAIFACDDFDFHVRVLDAYHVCSLSTLLVNHMKDVHHRLIVPVTPIYFDELNTLSRLAYSEGESVNMFAYFGNPNHPKIKRRLRQRSNSYRIQSGVDKIHFTNLFERVGLDD